MQIEVGEKGFGYFGSILAKKTYYRIKPSTGFFAPYNSYCVQSWKWYRPYWHTIKEEVYGKNKAKQWLADYIEGQVYYE